MLNLFKHALQFPFVEVVEDGVLSLREYFLLRCCGFAYICTAFGYESRAVYQSCNNLK